jgi:hypothetical protein
MRRLLNRDEQGRLLLQAALKLPMHLPRWLSGYRFGDPPGRSFGRWLQRGP